MRKVGQFFHFSKLGNGHSEAIGYAKRHYGRVPEPTRYETNWWDRTVHLDGGFYNQKGERIRPDASHVQESLACAEGYANQVCIGNLSMLRRFLEESIKKSDVPINYIDQMRRGLFNLKGKLEFEKREKLIIPSGRDTYIPQFMKMCLGLTRRREFLNDSWADDTKLWLYL